MAFNATTGLGVAAKITAVGNESVQGSTVVRLSLTDSNGFPKIFQLNPNIEDVAGTEQATGTPLVLTAAAPTPAAFTLTAVTVPPAAFTLTSVGAASAGSTVYTGTITGGGSSAFLGFTFVIAGFDLTANNGTFYCTASSATTLTLSNAAGVADTHAGTATASTGSAVYTGTITGGATSAFAGLTFAVTGFDDAVNNGTFVASASSATTLTLGNAAAVADTHAGTATATTGATAYTGTITGGGTNALAGFTFVVAGFDTAANNGTFMAVASTTTVLTLANIAGVADTHAGTATQQEVTALTYVVYPSKNLVNGTATAIVTCSSAGLITATAEGATIVEISFPTFNNSVGDIVSSGNIMNGLPINKIYKDIAVHVGA